MFPTFYRGSVKDLLGPVSVSGSRGVIFDYSDAYSVFDWGRMPDPLVGKGAALATIAADWFEKLEKPETWKEFSRTQEALELRKGNRFGSGFVELGEKLQSEGLRTHFLGAMVGDALEAVSSSKLREPAKRLLVREVAVTKPRMTTVLGRNVPDYTPTREERAPKLIPLEVIFRFNCPQGSSYLERMEPGHPKPPWGFPVLEVFTKLETTDRLLTFSEALAISGIAAERLQEVLFKTAWVAGWLKSVCARAGLELADGKLEWGLNDRDQLILVDAIGPDELRILKDGVQLSKEFLRIHYRATDWYAQVSRAKKEATQQGVAEWKRLVAEGPPHLPTEVRELGSQLYQVLANGLTGRQWFPQAWSLDRVTEGIRNLGGRS